MIAFLAEQLRRTLSASAPGWKARRLRCPSREFPIKSTVEGLVGLMGTRLTQERRDREVDLLRESENGNRSETLLRFAIILSVAVMLWVAAEQAITVFWGLAYIVMQRFHAAQLDGMRAPTTQAQLTQAVAVRVFVTVWYCGMVVYVAILDAGEYALLAFCGCIGLALLSLTRNIRDGIAARIDFWATILTSIGVVVASAVLSPVVWSSLAKLVGGFGAIAYFAFSYRQIRQIRRKLTHRIRAETQDHKMRAMGQLTSGIAHDFNNLLTVVSGNIELALLDPDGRQTTRYLDEAHAAADRGAALVQQLLAYAGQSRLTKTDIELRTLFERLSTVLKRVLPAPIDLQLIVPTDGMYVSGDPAVLESALLNLVINARDAIGDGPGTITLRAEPMAGDEFIGLIVEDTGPGMEAPVIERAVEPFFTTKKHGQGSGLGLSMVQGFAEQSGGALLLENIQTGGFRATLRLPLGAAPFVELPLVASGGH